VTDYVEVTLDGRPLKTPGGNKIRLPPQKKLFATLVANEWDVQDTILKPHTLPLVSGPCWSHTETKKRQTSIASRAIDGLTGAENRLAVANTLVRYFDTDTIWCDER
jgi:ATP synthase F1 complex assembly factor 2